MPLNIRPVLGRSATAIPQAPALAQLHDLHLVLFQQTAKRGVMLTHRRFGLGQVAQALDDRSQQAPHVADGGQDQRLQDRLKKFHGQTPRARGTIVGTSATLACPSPPCRLAKYRFCTLGGKSSRLLAALVIARRIAFDRLESRAASLALMIAQLGRALAGDDRARGTALRVRTLHFREGDAGHHHAIHHSVRTG